MSRWRLAVAAATVGASPAGAERVSDLLAAEVGHTESEVVYRENKLALHRYEPDERRFETPVVVVYALVNRPYILDLQPDRSVVRRLLEAGFAVYLIDWGEPSRLDRALSIEDYVTRYLQNCVDAARDDAGAADVHLLGYCMGGTLTVMYAATHADRVRTLTLLAAPIALEGTGGVLERWAEGVDVDAVVDALGNVPAGALAVAFSMLNPVENHLGKYVRLAENADDGAFVENFARLERWIWDGVDVAGEAFREFVGGIYRRNELIAGEFVLGDDPVDLSEIDVPVQQVVGEDDDIVPPAASEPLNDAIGSDDERIVEFPAGHVGLSVSSSAHEELWPDVCRWLADRDAREAGGECDAPAAGTATADPADEPGDANGHDASVRAVRGIGPTYAGRLEAAGVETVDDLRARDSEELAEIADASPARVENWLAAAGRV